MSVFFDIPGTMTCNEIKHQRQEQKLYSSEFVSRRSPKFLVGQAVIFTDNQGRSHTGRISNVMDNYGTICYHITSGQQWYRYIDQSQIQIK